MIEYHTSIEDISSQQLRGFFHGWPSPPSPETHLRLLQQSDEVVLAFDTEQQHVVGFITALTDHTLFAFIPLLEVLPPYQGQGIGSELVQRMMATLHNLYAVDLVCDPTLQPFYERCGMRPLHAMSRRN